MKPFISYIVPVYKVKHYLARCIDSLLQQGLNVDEYEILLIDDGSPDNCGAICDEYAVHFSQIQVFHQPNGGLSDARNTGIKVARGEYIQFVDSDDYLEPDSAGHLIEQIKMQNLDILRFNYENVNDKEEIIHPVKNPKLFSDYSDTVTDGLSFLTDRLGFACYAWQFILRIEIARQYPFLKGIHFEDTEWVSRMMPTVGRIASSERLVYYYRQRKDSITTGVNAEKLKKNINDKIQIIEYLQQRKTSFDKQDWFDGMISTMVISVLGIITNFFYHERKGTINRLKSLKVFPISSYHLTKEATRKRFLINLSPDLFCIIYHFAK